MTVTLVVAKPTKILDAGAAVGAAVGFAVEFAASELEKEATAYEAQFDGQGFVETGVEDVPTEIEIVRTTKVDSVVNEAFRFQGQFENTAVVRRVPDSNGNPVSTVVGYVLRLNPEKLTVDYSKAKVFSNEFSRTWWLTPLLGRIFRTSGDEVEVDLDIVLEVTMVDPTGQASTSDLVFNVPGQRVELGKEFVFPASAVFPAKGVFVPGSAVAVRVRVTERDPSNAQKFIRKLAEAVRNQKKTLVNVVSADGD